MENTNTGGMECSSGALQWFIKPAKRILPQNDISHYTKKGFYQEMNRDER